ncbi:hypothetical protein FRUB_08112 [Fimbriiglobus ruber]|uniref:Uncharacterized protein n=1 Tax=Fimbriiglobus ruber TaxID=1908690 RepID=A0A225DEH1_9BACT|nr:hypothetical protein FRUB_08112 [Fimbriiglobus ruber]
MIHGPTLIVSDKRKSQNPIAFTQDSTIPKLLSKNSWK